MDIIKLDLEKEPQEDRIVISARIKVRYLLAVILIGSLAGNGLLVWKLRHPPQAEAAEQSAGDRHPGVVAQAGCADVTAGGKLVARPGLRGQSEYAERVAVLISTVSTINQFKVQFCSTMQSYPMSLYLKPGMRNSCAAAKLNQDAMFDLVVARSIEETIRRAGL
jgi:hypothetical protein